MRIVIDTSELKTLTKLLRDASGKVEVASEDALGRAVAATHAGAVANAAKVRDTGEMMESVDYDTSGQVRRVWSDTRQAVFQEYGSPNTGAPNPWLSGPAEEAATQLIREMARAARPW